MLIFGSFILLGNYMSYDYPTYLAFRIKKDMFNYDELVDGEESDFAKNALYKYQSLYLIYLFPNFILPLMGGFLIDKIGLRKAIMI